MGKYAAADRVEIRGSGPSHGGQPLVAVGNGSVGVPAAAASLAVCRVLRAAAARGVAGIMMLVGMMAVRRRGASLDCSLLTTAS